MMKYDYLFCVMEDQCYRKKCTPLGMQFCNLTSSDDCQERSAPMSVDGPVFKEEAKHFMAHLKE
jgi:hypothetical protein